MRKYSGVKMMDRDGRLATFDIIAAAQRLHDLRERMGTACGRTVTFPEVGGVVGLHRDCVLRLLEFHQLPDDVKELLRHNSIDTGYYVARLRAWPEVARAVARHVATTDVSLSVLCLMVRELIEERQQEVKVAV